MLVAKLLMEGLRSLGNKIAPGLGDKFAKLPPITPFHLYIEVEEKIRGQVDEPLLMEWIIQTRDDALKRKPRPIPPIIYSKVSNDFNSDLLDRVVYVVAGGERWSLDTSTFKLGDKSAITLDYVVVFRKESHVDNVKLWAHELVHVSQYARWGIRGFARKYAEDYREVEEEAAGVAARY